MMRKVKDYFPEVYDRYYLSEDGTLFTDYGRKRMSDRAKQNGYIVNSLYGENGYRKDFKRHFLVAKIFLIKEREEQNQVNHIDGNKENNASSNLEWCTSKENINHAWRTHLAKPTTGEKCSFSVLTEKQVLEIVKLLQEKKTVKEIAKRYKVNTKTISAIKNRRSWRDTTKNLDF